SMARRTHLWVMLLSLFALLGQLAAGQQAKTREPLSPTAITLISADDTSSGTRLSSATASSTAVAPADAAPQNDVVIRGGTILTLTHGKIENGSIYIHNGKIAAIGKTVNAPANATVIDASGKFVMPGLIDSHSHIALDDDVNEATSPVTPHMM